MPDPISGEWLSAVTAAIESQPAGSSAAHLARVALEAAVPLVRAEHSGSEAFADLAWLLAVGFDVQIGRRDRSGSRYYVIRLGDSPGWDGEEGEYETPAAALAAERTWAEQYGHAPEITGEAGE